MVNTSSPVSLHVEHLKGLTRHEAQLYVEHYIARRHVHPTSYYTLLPYQNGFVAEIQEGGNGRTLITPLLLQRDPTSPEDTQVMVETAQGRVIVEISPAGVQTLILPSTYPMEPTALTPGESMTRVTRADYQPLMLTGLRLVGLAATLALVVAVFRPGASVHVVAPGPASPLLVPSWTASQALPQGATVRTLRYDDGRFSVTPHTEAVTP